MTVGSSREEATGLSAHRSTGDNAGIRDLGAIERNASESSWVKGGHRPERAYMPAKDRPTRTAYAAVVLYYRLGPDISATVEALLQQSLPPAEIVLVDNCSSDGVLAELEATLDESIRILYLPENLGYAGGMEAGCSVLTSDAPLVLMMTHEVLLDRFCAAEMAAAFIADPTVSQAGPIISDKRSQRTWSTGGHLNRSGGVAHDLTLPQSPLRDADWLDGCCSMVPRRLITPDLFDKRYFLYWEDVDMSSTLAHQGRVVVVRDAQASQSTGTAPIYFAVRNRILYWRKRRRPGLAAIATLHPLLKLFAVDTLRADRAAATSRWYGIVGGWTGKLHKSHTNIRERRIGNAHE